MFVCCTYGAITDKFQPIHVYLSLFFSFGVILAAGIVMIYFGHKKNVKPKESVDDYHTPVQMPDKKTVKILLQELQKRTSQDSIKIESRHLLKVSWEAFPIGTGKESIRQLPVEVA